jgi:hypothetical protein
VGSRIKPDSIVLLHMYMVCHHLRDPIRLKRPHAWFAPVVLLLSPRPTSLTMPPSQGELSFFFISLISSRWVHLCCIRWLQTQFSLMYFGFCSTIGVHPAEKVAAAAASLILSVFTTILVLWE